MRYLVVLAIIFSLAACSNSTLIKPSENNYASITQNSTEDSSLYSALDSRMIENVTPPDSLVISMHEDIARNNSSIKKESKLGKFFSDAAKLLMFFAVIGVGQGGS